MNNYKVQVKGKHLFQNHLVFASSTAEAKKIALKKLNYVDRLRVVKVTKKKSKIEAYSVDVIHDLHTVFYVKARNIAEVKKKVGSKTWLNNYLKGGIKMRNVVVKSIKMVE